MVFIVIVVFFEFIKSYFFEYSILKQFVNHLCAQGYLPS
jgi:hypothetical protein